MNNRLELPELDINTLGTWLTLLTDRELPNEANRKLVDFLDQNPQHWRDCAIMLWDEFSLRDNYIESQRLSSAGKAIRVSGQSGLLENTKNPENDGASGIRVPASVVDHPHRNGSLDWRVSCLNTQGNTKTEIRVKPMSTTGWCAAAAVLMIVFSAGWLTSGKFSRAMQTDNRNDQLLAEIGDLKRITSNLAAGWAAEQSTLRSVADLFPDAPMLLEIESTPWRTVYLSDRPASDQMINALASMSDKVTVEPFEPEIVTPLWRSLNRPVVAIEVLNNDFPLLTGVQK